MEIQLGTKEKGRERESKVYPHNSDILILWTIFKANSLLRAPLSRIKSSLPCCKCFFTAGYKYLGNKMKQKPCPVSYLVLEFKNSGKETFRKRIFVVIKSTLVHYRITFLCFVVGFIGEESLDFALKENKYFICFIFQSPTLFLFVLMRNLRTGWTHN